MPIKIKSTGGGSVSIDVPNTGSDFTLTAPANNATLFTTSGGTITGDVAFTSNNVTIGDNAISPFSMRNRVINGAMEIAQRGTSFTNVGSGVTPQYTLDRWAGNRGAWSTNQTVSQQAGFGGFNNCVRVQRASGDTNTNGIQIFQIIESVNMRDLAGKTVTLSFWARAGADFSASSSLLSVYCGTGTVADQGSLSYQSGTWTGQATPGSASYTLSTTATKYSLTFAIPSNALEMYINFVYGPSGTAGANDFFEITGVQLEEGSVATPFERRPFGLELQLCQRYYEKSFDLDIAPGPAGTSANHTKGRQITVTYGDGGGNHNVSTFYKVVKRSNPTVKIWNNLGSGGAQVFQGSYTGGASYTLSYSGTSGFDGFTFAYTVNGLSAMFYQWESSAEL